MMMLSELGGKEIVNLNNGERLGIIADSDIIVDEKTGKIITLLVPERKLQFMLFKESEDIEIPWHTIRKIGNDMVIVELEIF
jgi:YlmC/YmxH family sporulation protein